MKRPLAASLLALSACTSMDIDSDPTATTTREFGIDQQGRPATLWTLRNGHMEVDLCDRGATIVSIRVPDLARTLGDVVLGFDDVSGYESDANQYFGCTVGRVCNRIANGSFRLGDVDYVIAQNDGPNHLHGGGPKSLDKVHWQGEAFRGDNGSGVRFRYTSPDGEEGYPGRLAIEVVYTLTPEDCLQIDYAATTDRVTPVNLTNHCYFNLGVQGSATVLDHVLRVEAEHFTPTDDRLIPTGAIQSVIGTPLDFRVPVQLGARIASLLGTAAKGYDHNLVLREGHGKLRQVAELRHKPTGRVLRVETTEPALQVYSGNFLFGQRGKRGRSYAQHSAVCLETQHYPDSVHHASFPSILLEPGREFRSTTRYCFAVE